MQVAGFSGEKQAQFEEDAAAFAGLRPGQQRRAEFWAKHAFACRQGLIAGNAAVMRAVDWFYDRLVVLPARALKAPAQKTWNKLAACFNRAASPKPVKTAAKKTAPEAAAGKAGKFWRATKEKCAAGWKKTAEFFECNVALGLYRATEWAFDPRRRSGKPFFGNEKVNKVVGTTLGVGAFLVLSAWVGWLEVMSKVWHAQLARRALTSHAPWLVRIAKQAVLHPVLSVVVAAAQFVVVPSIAAARQALKSTKFSQGVAYQYNVRLRAARQTPPPPSAPGWKPSAYMDNLYREIVEKSSPEFYKARLRHFEARRREKQAAKSATPQAKLIAPPVTPIFFVAGDGSAPGKAFNDNAPPGLPPAAAPPVPGKPRKDGATPV